MGGSSARTPRVDLKKSTFFGGFQILSAIIGTLPTHPSRFQGAQAISLKLCDLGTSPEITGEVAPLENEFSDLLCFGGNLEHAKFDFLQVFAGIFRALICPKRCKRMEIVVLSQPRLAIKTVSLLNLKFTKSGPLQNVAGFKPP